MEDKKTARVEIKKTLRLLVLVVIALLLVSSVVSSSTIVPEGHVGVKYQFGQIVDDNLSAGLQFSVPFIQTIKAVDVREQTYETTTAAYTRDTQTVEGISVKLNYMYSPAQLSNIIKNIGISNVESNIVVPRLNSILKNEVGRYKAEDLVQGRAALQSAVETQLRESLERDGIIVRSFNILNIDFEDGFEAVIRSKVEAEQQALTTKNETIRKEEEARQQVIAAQAQADAAKLAAEAEAYSIELIQQQLSASPEYIALRRIEKWDGKFPQIMGNEVNPFVILEDE